MSNIMGTKTEIWYLSWLANLEENDIEQSFELGLVDASIGGTKDIEVWNIKNKLGLVGAGIGGNISNTKELKVMNFCEAMKSIDADKWMAKVAKKKERFDTYNVMTIMNWKDLPSDAKVLSTTWAIKQKTSGEWCGQFNARHFEQLGGQHYFTDTIVAPVTNSNTIQILLTLMCMHPKWIAEIIDVEGVFLQGEFENGEIMYIDVLDGMEKYYGKQDVVLLLNIPIYGIKQAASCFYKTLVKQTKN